MALNIGFGGASEYTNAAERARRDAESSTPEGGGLFGGASPIAVVLDLLGIGRQVAEEPEVESGAVDNGSAAVIRSVEEAVALTPTAAPPLPDLTLPPLSPISGRDVPRAGAIRRIDPTTGLPL